MNDTQIKFPGPVTRIEADQYRHGIIVEYKGPGNEKFYKKLDFSGGVKETEPDIKFDHSEYHFTAVSNAFMVFTKIADPTNQNEQELLVYDMDSEKVVEHVKGRKFSGFRSPVEIEVVHLGFESINSEKVLLEDHRRESGMSQQNLQLHFPYLLHRAEARYREFKDLILTFELGEPVFDFELLECNEKLLTGVHLKLGDCFQKSILIFDENAEVPEKIDMYSKLNKRTTDTFFVYGNFLIFVSEYDRLHLIDKNAI